MSMLLTIAAIGVAIWGICLAIHEIGAFIDDVFHKD